MVDTTLQTKQAAIHDGGVCQIFRGVQFHIEVLGNSKEILSLTKSVEKLDNIEDSKMLGDLMIACGLITKMKQVMGGDDMGGVSCCGGGGPAKGVKKWPELVKEDVEHPEMADGGVYMIVEEEVNSKVACLYFVLCLAIILAIISMPIWPDWLFNFVYNRALKIAIPASYFLAARFLLWYIPFHLGVSLWVLPNIFYLKDIFTPVEFSLNQDLLTPSNLIIRVVSLGVTGFGGFMAHEYINERIALRKKNETIQQWVALWVKKYSKTKYKEYHY